MNSGSNLPVCIPMDFAQGATVKLITCGFPYQFDTSQPQVQELLEILEVPQWSTVTEI